MSFKRSILLMMILLISIIAQGCETAKAVKSDTIAFGDKISKADTWISEHLSPLLCFVRLPKAAGTKQAGMVE